MRISDWSSDVCSSDLLHPEALDILARAGATVTPGSQRVRLDRGLVKAALASAPAAFTLHARNPAHDLPVGGRNIAFGSVASAPNARSEEHTSELQSLMRISYAVFCLKKKTKKKTKHKKRSEQPQAYDIPHIQKTIIHPI